MPTFTAIALENLLEPTVRVSLKKPLDSVNNKPCDQDSESRPRHLYISPALYATPEQASIAAYSSPEPLSPSPYVANHKRRRSGNETRSEAPELARVGEGGGFSLEEEDEDEEVDVGDNFVNSDNLVDSEYEYDDVGEATSMGSETETRQIDSRSFVSAQGEFFDANDDFSSDGSLSNTPSAISKVESELNALRSSLLEELEKRKTVEETLYLMQCQWERISKLMSQAGFTFPAPPAGTGSMQLYNDVMDQFSQEVVVTRFVAEAIGRAEARAEAEEAFASIVESKDQEILRLRDRLQYYETVNHELSQRKLVEVARRQQERKKSRRRWMWSFTGLSIAIGASLVAYSCVPPASKYLSLLKSADSTDTSSAASNAS